MAQIYPKTDGYVPRYGTYKRVGGKRKTTPQANQTDKNKIYAIDNFITNN